MYRIRFLLEWGLVLLFLTKWAFSHKITNNISVTVKRKQKDKEEDNETEEEERQGETDEHIKMNQKCN